MRSNVQTLPQEMEKCEKFKKWTAVFELAKPKVINIPLHALTKMTQRSFTVSSQSKESEIVNHTTIIKKQPAQFKLTEETRLLATKTEPGGRESTYFLKDLSSYFIDALQKMECKLASAH